MSSLVLIYRHRGTPRNQKPTTSLRADGQVEVKGKCTFDRKCTKFITVTFSILGHMIYSVVFIFPNYNLCLFVRLQKVTIRIVCAYKIPTFSLTIIYTH